MIYYATAAIAVISYLLGSINTSIILSRSIYGKDIRKSGSGNAGATNMLRTHGKGIAVATLICDVLKGTIAVVLGMWFDIIFASNANTITEAHFLVNNLKYIAAIFVVLGHDFPIFFGFKGGKGVATSLGVIMMLNWEIGLIVLFAAIAIMAVSRYVSLGSISAAALYPFILFIYITAAGEKLEEYTAYIIMSLILALMLILKHHTNIRKLINGNENKLFAKKETVAELSGEENEI